MNYILSSITSNWGAWQSLKDSQDLNFKDSIRSSESIEMAELNADEVKKSNLFYNPALETKRHPQDYSNLIQAFSFDDGSGEDLLQEEIRSKITGFKEQYPRQLRNSQIMDDLALAILNTNEMKAILDIAKLVEGGDSDFLVASLENEYEFLVDWASQRSMHEVAEILKNFLGLNGKKIASQDDFFEVIKQGLKDELLAEKGFDLSLNTAFTTPLYKFVKSNWNIISEEYIAKALTQRDSQLVQAIEWDGIEKWVKSGDPIQPQAVSDLELAFQETINWIGFQITSEADETKRQLLVDKFIKTGRLLLEKHNFHGACQVAYALDVVSGYLPRVKEVLKYHLDLIKLCRFKTHENYLKDFKDTTCGSTRDLLPVSHVFWFELKEDISKFGDRSAMHKYRSILENFSKTDFQSDKDIYRNLEEICRSRGMREESIQQYACLSRQWNFSSIVDFTKDIIDWNPYEFAEFFINANPDFSLINQMHDQGIYCGKKFIEVFSLNKKLIENCQVETQCAIWKHYLKHLSFKNTIKT